MLPIKKKKKKDPACCNEDGRSQVPQLRPDAAKLNIKKKKNLVKVSNQRNFIDLSSMVIYFLFSPFWPTVKPVTPRSLVYGYLFPFFPFGQELNCRPPQWKLGIQPTRPPRNSKPVYFSTTIWRSPVKSLERGEVIDDQETNPTSHALNSKAYFHG